jgi:hypothetical protein
MIKFFPLTDVVLMPGIKATEISSAQLARYRKYIELGIFETPIGRLNHDGQVEVVTSCEFVEAVRTFPEIQGIHVDVRDFNDDQMVELYEVAYPLQSQIENLAHQGVILQNHLSLKNLKVSQVIKAKAFPSEGGPYTRQYANLLIGHALAPSWLHSAIQTHPRLKSLPSKLLVFAPYKDFAEAFWNFLKDAFSSEPENLSKVTIRQFNQLLALFKPLLRGGQEQEACRLLTVSSIQQLLEECSISISTCPAPTSSNLRDDESSQPIYSHPEIGHYKKLQHIRRFHYTRLTRKGFSHLNEVRARYWNLVIDSFGNIRPSFISHMSDRGCYNPVKLQEYLDQISEYKELEADLLSLSEMAPNNPYAEPSPLQSKLPPNALPYKSKLTSPNKAQVSIEYTEEFKSQEFWSTLQSAIEDLTTINEIEIKGIPPSLASSLGLNVIGGKVYWYPSLPIYLPPQPIARGTVHPAFLICTSQDETLLTPQTPGKNLGLVPFASGPPAVRCQFPDQLRVLPLKSVILHPQDLLDLEQSSQNK